MKLSTRTRYGTRAMLDVALHPPEVPRSTKEIADQQELSVKYLESLLATLRQAGLLRSVRGAAGGHLLAREPRQITLWEIFEALEGTEPLVPCTAEPDACPRVNACVTREVWSEVQAACHQVLESITLQDLVERAKARQQTNAGMYYI